MSRFFQRRGRTSNQYKGDKWKGKTTKEREPKGACYICNKQGHFAANCPTKTEKNSASKDTKMAKENKFIKRRHHKANMAATWDDSDASDSDQSTSGEEVANMCFMAHNEKPHEVTPSLNFLNCFMALDDNNLDDEITLEEALLEYEKLFKIHIETKRKLECYKKKYEHHAEDIDNLRKERNSYKDKYTHILKEVDAIKSQVEKISLAMSEFNTQKFVHMYKTMVKGKFISAEPTLSKSNHASTSRTPPLHTHKGGQQKQHIHTPTCMHNKVKNNVFKRYNHHTNKRHHAHYYTPMFCDYCGRRGHVEKFCYDKVKKTTYSKNRFTWKRDTNNLEPKEKWVPKSSFVSTGITNKGAT